MKEISYTIDDRDRIIRTEQSVIALEKKMDVKYEDIRSEMNSRFDAIDKRFDQLFNFLWAIIGIFTSMMIAVFGFAFWDRKLSLAPIKKENSKVVEVLRDFSEHQPRLREILKNAGLL